MKLTDVLRKIAPALATAVAGPIGGLAVQVLGDALGVPEPTQDKIQQALKSGQLTGEQIAAIKAAEQAFLVRCKELDIDIERIHGEDRKGAREMLIATRARTPAALSWLVVLGTFICYGYMLKHGKPAGLDDVILGRMLGTLDMAFGIVLAFWLGTSHSSRSKDDTITSLSKV